MTRQITGQPLWSGGLRSAISTSSLVRINLVDYTECCALSQPPSHESLYSMLSCYRSSTYVSTNVRQTCIYFSPGNNKHIPCQLHEDSGAEGSAPSHRSPWSTDAHGLPHREERRRRESVIQEGTGGGPRSCRGLRHRVARRMTNWNAVGDAGGGISRHECQRAPFNRWLPGRTSSLCQKRRCCGSKSDRASQDPRTPYPASRTINVPAEKK